MSNLQRGKGKVKTDYTQNDLYNFYKENSQFNLDIKKIKFNKIIKKFNRELIKLILYKNFAFKMPYTLGTLRIKKYKYSGIQYDENNNIIKKKLLIDYKKTKDLWERNPAAKEEKKLVLHLNEHSDGYLYRFYWDKTNGKLRNKEAYKFIPSRTNKRWLASVIKDETLKVDFFE
jgi:hypothetical protein